jgi:hypothetical protein
MLFAALSTFSECDYRDGACVKGCAWQFQNQPN